VSIAVLHAIRSPEPVSTPTVEKGSDPPAAQNGRGSGDPASADRRAGDPECRWAVAAPAAGCAARVCRVKLVLIYGPLAVGKTTVGRELAQATGYRFFFNHLTVPVADAIFPRRESGNQDRYSDLLKKIRLACLTAAAQEGVDVIFTLAYSGAVDDEFVADIVHAVSTHGGVTHFVELRATEAVLRARVGNESRKALGKVTDPDRLSQVLTERDLTASVKHPGVLTLDTSTRTPTESAKAILEVIDPGSVR